jgi:formylglycine-generating enzyme required for sulfatase activity
LSAVLSGLPLTRKVSARWVRGEVTAPGYWTPRAEDYAGLQEAKDDQGDPGATGLQGPLGSTAATPPSGMILIPAGLFKMGETVDGTSDAVPVTANISAFYMDVNEVSWSQWQSMYFWATNHRNGSVNAGAGKAANHPVQSVNWDDCVNWCNARPQQAGKTPVYYTDLGLTQVYANWLAKGYRLPTEAEWEVRRGAG